MNDTQLTERRDLVIDRLSSGYAQGLFELEELDRRLTRAHAARNPMELDALVTDLVPASTALVPVQRTRVVFGSLERTGTWAMPQQLTARVVCGNLVLDLREAQLAAEVTTIEVNVTLGNVEVIVPPGMSVELDASSFLGNAAERVERVTTARGPVVRIVGRVKLGNLEVETRRVGEGAGDARRRRRAERRAHRRWSRMRRACRW
jgi:hypothetical protein